MVAVFKVLGVLGLLLISIGVVTKNRKSEDILYILGGLCLEAYSFYLRDVIFMTLQLVFTIAATYDLVKLIKK